MVTVTNKQRGGHTRGNHKNKKKTQKNNVVQENVVLSPPTSNTKSPHIESNSSNNDKLIAELHEHIEQGRIFDARSVVHELSESESPLQPDVKHIMDEVITQSDHVESLLRELHSDDNWTLAKQKSGVTVHYRREEDSPIHTVRASTEYHNFTPKDFTRFCALFAETELMHKWFPGGVMKPCNLLSWHSKYSKVIQLRINVGLPMISARDAVVLGSGYHLPDRNAFLISTTTIVGDTCRYCDIPKPAKGVVRMTTESIFYVQLVKRDVISFKMIGRDDLKLKYMPSALLNYLSQGHLPFDLMKTVHRTIRNFEGTVWEEKIAERGVYYTEIEDKVYEAIEKWEQEEGGQTNVQMESKISQSNTAKMGLHQTVKEQPHIVSNYDEVDFFVSDEKQDKGRQHAVFVTMAVLIVSALCIMYPEAAAVLLSEAIYLPKRIQAFLEEGNPTDTVKIVIMSFSLPVMVTISSYYVKEFKDDVKEIDQQQQQHQQSLNQQADNGVVDEPSIDSGYDEFLRIIADKDNKIETKKGKKGKTNPPQFFDSASPETKATKVDGIISNLSEVSDITTEASPKGGDSKQLTKPTTNTTQSSPAPRRRVRKVRSTLSTGLKGIQRVASLPVVTGKRKNT